MSYLCTSCTTNSGSSTGEAMEVEVGARRAESKNRVMISGIAIVFSVY